MNGLFLWVLAHHHKCIGNALTERVCVRVRPSVRSVHLIDIGTVSIDFSRRLSVSSVLFLLLLTPKQTTTEEKEEKQSVLSILLLTTNANRRRKKSGPYKFQWQFIHSSHYAIPKFIAVRRSMAHKNAKILCILNHFQMSLCFRNVAHHVSSLSLSVFLSSFYLIPLSPRSLSLSLLFILFIFIREKSCLFDSFISLHTNIQTHTSTKMKFN